MGGGRLNDFDIGPWRLALRDEQHPRIVRIRDGHTQIIHHRRGHRIFVHVARYARERFLEFAAVVLTFIELCPGHAVAVSRKIAELVVD